KIIESKVGAGVMPGAKARPVRAPGTPVVRPVAGAANIRPVTTRKKMVGKSQSKKKAVLLKKVAPRRRMLATNRARLHSKRVIRKKTVQHGMGARKRATRTAKKIA